MNRHQNDHLNKDIVFKNIRKKSNKKRILNVSNGGNAIFRSHVCFKSNNMWYLILFPLINWYSVSIGCVSVEYSTSDILAPKTTASGNQTLCEHFAIHFGPSIHALSESTVPPNNSFPVFHTVPHAHSSVTPRMVKVWGEGGMGGGLIKRKRERQRLGEKVKLTAVGLGIKSYRKRRGNCLTAVCSS